LEFLGEIGFSMSLKKVLTDPFGLQISTFMALSMEKGKKGLFMGPGFFGGKAGAIPQSIGCNLEICAQ
jgi:hypothetical protein